MNDSITPTSGLIGNRLQVDGLGRAVAAGRVNHAYLIHGPAGVGKSTLAKWLAARLNCSGPEPPCGACASCRRIGRGADPNARLLQAASEREPELALPFDPAGRSGRTAERSIGVDLVKELQHDAALSPADGGWKVYLIVGAETMSPDAANRLLKTLEEPPSRVVLILTAVDPSDLLPTVVSRCQSIRLAPVPPEEIASALTDRFDLPAERAELLARLSGGRPGWAIRAASQPDFIAERDAALADLVVVHHPSLRERLGVAERLAGQFSKDPGAVYQCLATWQSYWWDVCLAQKGLADRITNLDHRSTIEGAARKVPPERVRAYLKRMGEGSQWLLQNVNPRLALEATVIVAPTVH
jgi:DNA polymerase-3 subunit delta'